METLISSGNMHALTINQICTVVGNLTCLTEIVMRISRLILGERGFFWSESDISFLFLFQLQSYEPQAEDNNLVGSSR